MIRDSQYSIIGLVFFFALASKAAGATEYWVDGLNGSDTWSGECSDPPVEPSTCGPKSTIQEGLDVATTPGDVVTVLPGDYLNGFTMGAAQNGVTLRGLGEVVIVSGEGVLGGVEGARIEGLTFRFASTVLRLNGAPNAVINRCRFLDVDRGIYTSGGVSPNLIVRGCLFADIDGTNAHAIEAVGSTIAGLLVDRCTFARVAGRALYFSANNTGILARNSAFFENPAYTEGSTSFCNFFGGPPQPGVLGSNNIDDPLFIDPDNRVYHVKSGSPLLDQGADGGRIGAFGQGIHTSRDFTKDHPLQAGSPWGNWIDQNGDSIATSALVGLNANSEIVLAPGITEAAIYSEVFDTGGKFSVIRSIDFLAFEDTSPLAGSREIIDQDKATTQRELRIRTMADDPLGPFDQDPTTGPAWEVVDKHVRLDKAGRWVQIELVLRHDGN